MRTERFVISDHSWQILEPLLPGSSRSRGVTAKDNRLFFGSRVVEGQGWRSLTRPAARFRRMELCVPTVSPLG